jgi:hypothetical protein
MIINCPQNEDAMTERAESWSPRNIECRDTGREEARLNYGVDSNISQPRKQLAVKRACNDCFQQKVTFSFQAGNHLVQQTQHQIDTRHEFIANL